jgi:hypothetical protein
MQFTKWKIQLELNCIKIQKFFLFISKLCWMTEEMNGNRNEWVNEQINERMASVALGDLWSQVTCPHKSKKVPYSGDQVLTYKNKRVIYASGLLLWPLAAQNKVWFKKSNASLCYFSSLTWRGRTWRCLTSVRDLKRLKSSECSFPMRGKRPKIPTITHFSIYPLLLSSFVSLIIYSYFIHRFIPVFFHSPNIY